MQQKNRYLYYSILPCCLLLIVIGIYVSGYNPPTQGPPFGNLPAPINAGPDAQSKEGNLTIQGDFITEGILTTKGILKLGQFASAPDGAEGALYFDTANNKIKVYSSAAWSDLGGGAEPGQLPTYTTSQRNNLEPSNGMMIYNIDENQVQIYALTSWAALTGNKSSGFECANPVECAFGYCVDGVCCDSSCSGDCEVCNLVENEGICTVRAELDNTEVTTTCYYCNGTSDTSIAYTGTPGVNCPVGNFCYSGVCIPFYYCDEDNDGYYAEVLASCPSGRQSETPGNDCDDDCATCYSGSTVTTPSPDGKDQDCNGIIDDSICETTFYCLNVHPLLTGDAYCATLSGCKCIDTDRYRDYPTCVNMRSVQDCTRAIYVRDGSYAGITCGPIEYH